jgi:hypothetical protein
MDEDRTHHDDRVGLAHIAFTDAAAPLCPGWACTNVRVPLVRRKGNPKVYALNALAALWPASHASALARGYIVLSVRVLGASSSVDDPGRMYTLGPSTPFPVRPAPPRALTRAQAGGRSTSRP